MEEQLSPSVIDRRELLRRGAVVGGLGALAWAAPSVTTFGARAFAAGTPFAGTVSWVIVWFVNDDAEAPKWHRVKYENADVGYTTDPSANNTNSIISGKGGEGAFGSRAKDYVTKVDGEVALGRDFVGSVPTGVTATATSDGFLKLTLGETATVKIVDWILHDGSCNDRTDKIRTAAQPGDPAVGPPKYELDGEEDPDFLWRKCQ